MRVLGFPLSTQLASKEVGYFTLLPMKEVRKRVNDTIYACSFPKCVDMENGATDTEGLYCPSVGTPRPQPQTSVSSPIFQQVEPLRAFRIFKV